MYVVKSDYVPKDAFDKTAEQMYAYDIGCEPGSDLQDCTKFRSLRLASSVLLYISAMYPWNWYIVSVEERNADDVMEEALADMPEELRRSIEAIRKLSHSFAHAGFGQAVSAPSMVWVEVDG